MPEIITPREIRDIQSLSPEESFQDEEGTIHYIAQAKYSMHYLGTVSVWHYSQRELVEHVEGQMKYTTVKL